MLRLFAAAALLFAATSAASAQAPKELVGAWALVSSVIEVGGRNIEPYGPDPRGSLILDASGRYSAMIARSGLPKIAAGSPVAGTADENKAIVSGTIAHFGSYAVDGTTLTFRVEAASFPNWDGAAQQRTFTAAGDTLTYKADGGAAGGLATLVWRRVR